MYKVNILENDICIDTAIVSKEKAIEVQGILLNESRFLNRLKEQYEKAKRLEKYPIMFKKLNTDYLAMRLFCLDTQLISFNDIEVMEFEVNSSF